MPNPARWKNHCWLEQSSEELTVSTVPFFVATRYSVYFIGWIIIFIQNIIFERGLIMKQIDNFRAF